MGCDHAYPGGGEAQTYGRQAPGEGRVQMYNRQKNMK